eukprot:gene22160-biopygen13259
MRCSCATAWGDGGREFRDSPERTPARMRRAPRPTPARGPGARIGGGRERRVLPNGWLGGPGSALMASGWRKRGERNSCWEEIREFWIFAMGSRAKSAICAFPQLIDHFMGPEFRAESGLRVALRASAHAQSWRANDTEGNREWSSFPPTVSGTP